MPGNAQLDSAAGKTFRQGRSRDRHIVEAENLAAVLAAKMRMAIVSGCIGGGQAETEYALRIGDTMCQTALDHPVEHAIQRHAVETIGFQCKLDVVVRQRAFGSIEQTHHGNAGRCGTCPQRTDAICVSECCGIHGGEFDHNRVAVAIVLHL